MKQGCGAFWVHVCNVIMSVILDHTHNEAEDQCASYLGNGLTASRSIDGCDHRHSVHSLFYIRGRLFDRFEQNQELVGLRPVNNSFLKQGEYINRRGRFKIHFWVCQTLIWISVNILSKIVLSVLLFFIYKYIFQIAKFLVKPFDFSEVCIPPTWNLMNSEITDGDNYHPDHHEQHNFPGLRQLPQKILREA